MWQRLLHFLHLDWLMAPKVIHHALMAHAPAPRPQSVTLPSSESMSEEHVAVPASHMAWIGEAMAAIANDEEGWEELSEHIGKVLGHAQ